MAQQTQTQGVAWTLLHNPENERAAWSYDGRGTDGLFRLISVSSLLRKDNPELVLTEWAGLDFPHDGLDDFHPTNPSPNMPHYCAISHVWQPSEDAARRSNQANRPLRISLRNGTFHAISWLGLVQAATAAQYSRCDYIWLDLLCIDQTSPKDKVLQIPNMARIFSNASTTLIMVGGVHAAQSLDRPSAYMQRSWTFQEAILGPDARVLVHWDHPDSWTADDVNLSFDILSDSIALVRLDDLIGSGPLVGRKFGAGMLYDPKTGLTYRRYRLRQDFNCLGLDQTALTSLAVSLRQTLPDLGFGSRMGDESIADGDSDSDSDFDFDLDTRFRALNTDNRPSSPESASDSDSRLPAHDTVKRQSGSKSDFDLDARLEEFNSIERPSEDTDSGNASNDETISHEGNYLPAGHNVVEYYLQHWDTPLSPSEGFDSGLGFNRMSGTLSTTATDIDSDDEKEMKGYTGKSILPFKELPMSEQTRAYFDIHYDYPSSAVGVAQAAWRNIWLRTSTEPQDLIFSMMHVLGVVVDVDYKRSTKDLLFELVDKSPIPGWLTVSYDMPVYPESGLIPSLPTFTSHFMPTYAIDGKFRRASELICSEFCCEQFDVVIKSTGKATDGHLVCARLFEVEASRPRVDKKDRLFSNVQLRLSSPFHQFVATCKYRGNLGSVVMMVGPAQDLHRDPQHGDGTWVGTPVIHFLDKTEQGVWRKTGTGFLDEPVFRSKYFLMDAVRRHLRIGGASKAAITECNCPLTRREKYMLHQVKGEQVGSALEKDCAGSHPSLFAAAARGHMPVIRRLLEQGADINAIDDNVKGVCRGTAMQGAASSPTPQKAILQLLIEAGSNLNARGGYYGTALQAAATAPVDTKEVVEYFVQMGADINLPGGRYGSALQAALFFGNTEIAKYLILAGADLAVEEKYQQRLDDVLIGMVADEESRVQD
ncbi:hypothetical protein CLCR_02254 [Cladophialophora carrionii]|uniref:Heterokaryon incompatibility domain-containing protein n=1 Tax=Cladophialophora carrionii TaxID=86049 RepID=A0A1C1CFD9_9EURO|nr:hypothetical protein CLCR_02254 [Cladophialophora carrionii]